MPRSARDVLHVMPAVAPRYGGPSAAVHGICRALEAAGCRTLVATTDADGPQRLDVVRGAAIEHGGTRMIFFRRAFGEAFKWSWGLARWLRNHVQDFDVVHVHAVFSHASLAAGAACRAAGVPYIVRPLGTLDPWSLRQKPVRKMALMNAGGRRLLRGAAAMHYTTADEMRLAESAVRDLPRGVVVPLGIDDDLFADGHAAPTASRDPYVLSLSRLDAKKGVDLLIRAFHMTAPTGRWRLVIAGAGEPSYVRALQTLAASGPARDRITFAGWASGDGKRELLRGAAVFALASQQENFGISVAESLAAGVPALVTPGVNLAPDIARTSAGWVVDAVPDALAAALAAVMADAPDRAYRGGQARQLAEGFRWPVVARELSAMYDEVAGASRHVLPAAAGAH
jgi:glycosyltransferase involved in cell wall biosynthesis